MEDERTTPSDTPTPSADDGERAEAEDTSPEDAPADPADDPDTDGDASSDDAAESDVTAEPAASERPASGSAVPRTTTTGDDDQDLRSTGDGAVSGAPGDDLDDAAQRHD